MPIKPVAPNSPQFAVGSPLFLRVELTTVPVLTPVKAKKELELDNRWDMSECQV